MRTPVLLVAYIMQNDFKYVSYKKKSRKPKLNNILHQPSFFDNSTTERRIVECKDEISQSDLFDSVLALLREALLALEAREITEIVCLGLGRFEDSSISRYQFGLLLCLKDRYGVQAKIYDPVYGSQHWEILDRLGCEPVKENCEGKFEVKEGLTLFFLPHCPKQLTNNLIWANWGLGLSRCIVISNSFSSIIERCSKRHLEDNASYMFGISPYTLELGIVNSFKYFEVFNDLSIHCFPMSKLGFVSKEVWEERVEPSYRDDLEFVTNHIDKLKV